MKFHNRLHNTLHHFKTGSFHAHEYDILLVHFGTNIHERLLNKPYVSKVILRGQNLPLKCCQHLKMLIYFEERFRSFHTINIKSVGQRATKLSAFEVGGLKKSFPHGLALVELFSPGSTLTGSESFSKFDG